jgi:hypothetical protein
MLFRVISILIVCLAYVYPAWSQNGQAKLQSKEAHSKAKQYQYALNEPSDWETISLIKLLAAPEKYEGRKLVVSGYIVDRFECVAIYPTQEFATHDLYLSGVWLDFDKKNLEVWADGKTLKYHSLDNKYASVAGIYTQKLRGHMGLFCGTLQNVRRVQLPIGTTVPVEYKK